MPGFVWVLGSQAGRHGALSGVAETGHPRALSRRPGLSQSEIRQRPTYGERPRVSISLNRGLRATANASAPEFLENNPMHSSL